MWLPLNQLLWRKIWSWSKKTSDCQSVVILRLLLFLTLLSRMKVVRKNFFFGIASLQLSYFTTFYLGVGGMGWKMDLLSKHACSPFFGCHFVSKKQFKKNFGKKVIFGGLPAFFVYQDFAKISHYPILRKFPKFASYAIDLKFGQDHDIDKRNVSWKFHQNPTPGRHFFKNSSYFEGLTDLLLRQNYEKYLPEVGFS